MSSHEITKNFFTKYALERFSSSATTLYFFLVEECNKKHWQNPFEQSDKSTTLFLGGSKNTWAKAKDELQRRGLISYKNGGNGRKDSCVYVLHIGGVSAALAPLKVSISDTIPPNKVSAMVSETDTLNPNKVSGKVSEIDTPYKEKTKTSSVVEDEEGGASSAAENPGQLSGFKKNAAAWAAHTGGDAAEGTAAQLVSFGEKMLFENSRYATPGEVQLVATNLSLGTIFPKYYINLIRTKYGEELRDERAWKNCVVNFLSGDSRSKSGVVRTDPSKVKDPAAKTGAVEKRRSAIEEAMALDDNEDDS